MNHATGAVLFNRPSAVHFERRSHGSGDRQSSVGRSRLGTLMSDRRNDVVVVCGAVLVLCLLSGVGTYGVRLAPGDSILSFDDARRITWLAWGFKILGKIPGHLSCGFILGAFLKHTTPRRVMVWFIGVILIGTCVTLYLPSLAGDYMEIQ